MAAEGKGTFAPDYAISPGETLREVIESLSISQSQLAERTDRPKKTINEIINGKAAITPETALQFEKVLGVPASFWNNLEQQYRTSLARSEERTRLEREVSWLRQFPVHEMVGKGWIESFQDQVRQLQELLAYFGVASPKAWGDLWGEVQHAAAFRNSGHEERSFGAIAAWLRKGELLARDDVPTLKPAPYDSTRFRKELAAIRRLTPLDIGTSSIEAKRRCAKAGVILVYVPELPKSRVCGATRWISGDQALVQLSLFYHRDDQFWFSFFHEAAHVLLHGKRRVFVEGPGANKDKLATGTKAEEEEANRFAADWLIPEAHWKAFVDSRDFGDEAIKEFAGELEIAPGIVVGRLQREEHLPYNKGTGLFRRIDWAASD